MKATLSAVALAFCASITSAAPFGFREAKRQASYSIEVTFNGARNDGATIQSVGVMWPVDSQFYTPQQVATQFPAAQYIDIAAAERVQNAGQSISIGDIVNDGTRITCTFAGVDGTTHTINNFPTDEGDVTFTIGAPTAFTSGECHEID